MSYELDQQEPFADGIRRIVVEQVDIAMRVLTDPRCSGGVGEAIHEARKCFKRVRSALRLARRVVGDQTFGRENARFRKLAMVLAGPRESGVAVLTIDGLTEEVPPMLRPGAFSELRAHFVEHHTVALWQTVEREEALIRVVRKLRKARRRLACLPSRDDSDLAWTLGVRCAYRAGVKWMAEAYSGRSPEAFHEWRKQAKHLRYHLDLLRGFWEGQLDRAADSLHELTDLLGAHHDLTDLREQLERRSATRATENRRAENQVLRGLINGRRVAIESEAREIGDPLYSRKPKAIVERLVSCWDHWRL